MKLLRFAAIAALFLVANHASAACINSAPNGSTLDIYSKPVQNGPLMGGVGVGECNIEVTQNCKNGFCQVFVGTLGGWADMSYISVASDEAPPTQFVYAVVGGSGTVTMAGQTQPTPVEKRGKVIFKPHGNGLMLTLPPEMGSPPVPLKQTGSGSFTGYMKNWGGFPMKVEVIAERISHPRATLELFAKNSMVKMDMKLDLKRTSRAKLTTKLSSNQSNGRSGGRAIGQPGTQNIKKPTSGSPAPARQAAQQPAPSNHSGAGQSLCGPLAEAIGPILRSAQGSARKRDLMHVLRQLGIFDLARATELQCFQVAVELVAAKVLSEAQIDISNSPYDGLGGPDPARFQGEDPKTMIEGGVEILPDEQDFAPARQASKQGNMRRSASPDVCLRLADHIIQILIDNRAGNVRSLQHRLIAMNLDSISGKTGWHCLNTIEDLRHEDLIR